MGTGGGAAADFGLGLGLGFDAICFGGGGVEKDTF